MKKITFWTSLLFLSVALLSGCGSKQTEKETASTAVDISDEEDKDDVNDPISFITEPEADTPAPIYKEEIVLSEDEIKELLAKYNGRYLYSDEHSYSCYLKIIDGVLYFESRGAYLEKTKHDLYVEDGEVYVELDKRTLHFIDKTSDWLEYTIGDSNLPYYFTSLTKADAEVFENELQYLTFYDGADFDEDEMPEGYGDEATESDESDDEEAEDESEKENNKEIYDNWIRGTLYKFSATEGFTEVTILISDSNYPGLKEGDYITVGGDEWDPCVDDFGPILMGAYGEGAPFEAVIDKHSCSSNNCRIVLFLG